MLSLQSVQLYEALHPLSTTFPSFAAKDQATTNNKKTKNVQTKRFASLPNFFSSLGIKDNFNHDNTMMDISKNHEIKASEMLVAPRISESFGLL